MEQFINFVIHHWPLWLALAVIVILLFLEESRGQVRGVSKLSPQETITLINRENAIVIDLRDKEAFAAGHIVGALNISADMLEKRPEKINKQKDKPIILIASTEQNAIDAGVKLRKQGFSKINTLASGLSAWKNAGFPLTKM